MLSKKELLGNIKPLLLTFIVCVSFFGFICFLTIEDSYVSTAVEVNVTICNTCNKPCNVVHQAIYNKEKQIYDRIDEMLLCNNCKTLILTKTRNIN